MTRSPLVRVARRLGTPTPDKQLLAQYLSAADEDAFAELVRRHERTVLAACRQVLSDSADVEDAFQATFLVLVQKAKSVRWDNSLSGWLFAVAHRVAVRAARTRARTARRESAAPLPLTASPDLSWREAVAALHEELDALPDRFRLPLVLCYLDGLSRDEAATQLGWKPGSVKAGLERGREKLRARLERRGVTLTAGLLAAVAAIGTATASANLIPNTVRAAGDAPAALLALTRPAVTTTTTRLKFLLGPALAAALGIGLLAAGANQPQPEKRPDTPKADKPPFVAGRVLGPDGKPVAGAAVFAFEVSGPADRRSVRATTGADGRFRLDLPADRRFTQSVFVTAAGFGVGRAEIKDARPDDLTVRLVADHPVTGRVVTTEGKPVAGARVAIDRIDEVPEGLDDFLTRYRTDPRQATAGRRTTPVDEAGLGTAVVTDADGRFKIAGGGRDRAVHLGVRAEGRADAGLVVVNRPGFDPAPFNEAAERADGRRRPRFRLEGPDLTVVTEAGKVLEGVVLDAETRKPIPGASVSDLRNPTRTDADGRFQLNGLRKAPRYTVYVNGPTGGDYLGRTAAVEDTEGYAPVACEVELRRGVVVTGTVTDKATGKPAPGVVTVFPVAGNKYYPEYHPGSRFVERGGQLTDAGGRFRVVTVPGKLVVTVQAHESVRIGGERLSPYRGSGPDPAHPEVFDTKTQPGYAYLDLADLSRHATSHYDHAVRIIDVEPGKPASVDFALDRGVTGRIRIEGPDGKPAPGATVFGLAHAHMPAKLPDATATVYALDPKAAPRLVIAVDQAKKLGGMATVRGDEREPVVVKLAPLADIKGKYVTAAGKPVAGAALLIDRSEPADNAIGALLNTQFGYATRPKVKTAADGTFTLEGVLPGVGYHVRMWTGKTFFPADPDAKLPTIRPESGKVFDLGTVNVGKLREDD